MTDAAIFAVSDSQTDFTRKDVSEALDLVSRNLQLKRGQLRLSDRLEALAGQEIISPKLDNLSDALYQKTKIARHNGLVEQIETIGDLAAFLAIIRVDSWRL